MKSTKFFSLLGVGFFVLFFLSFTTIVNFITDWWWFKETGYTEVFIKPIIVKITLGAVVALIIAVFLIGNFIVAIRSKNPWVAILPESLTGQAISIESFILRRVMIIFSLILALFTGIIIAANWDEALRLLFGVPFGESDPIFKRDIAFYIFSLPALNIGLGIIKTVIFVSLAGCVAIYILKGSFNPVDFLGKLDITGLKLSSKNKTEPKARIHLGLLLFIFLAVTVVDKYLSLFKLFLSQSGPVFGALYTDTNVIIPLTYLSIGITILLAIFALTWGVSGKITPLIVGFTLFVITNFATVIIPPLFQKLIVAPNELAKETPFIKHNIAATRKAYGLDKVEVREIMADKPLTATDIENNNLTIKNVRLWDRAPLLSTLSQIQEIRTYYKFISVDNDRYFINDEIRQVMLSPRELDSENLPNRSWINEKLIFTHGYGITASPVNQVTAEGLPVLFVKDLPPKSRVKPLTINRPEIYFGELTKDYVIVKTKIKEFNYPKGEENVYTTYQGKGGVQIDSFIKKVLFAIKFNSLKILLSNDVTSQSRILYHRNIKERVNKITPFLTLDKDPYVVVVDGKIYWILDAYTKTSKYPYSQPLLFNGESINYIRNSVKIVVDAYEGKVVFYQIDNNDPIIRFYAKIFPNLFKPFSQIPKNLVSNLRYPEDIFSLQTNIYTTYHMNNPQIFYNKEDQWEIPVIEQEPEKEAAGASAMGPRHMIMKLPGEKKEEYIIMLPFTPRNKDNLSAWMVARNDNQYYGKLVVYRFPKQKLVYGPKQIISRINQDAEISRQISLWDQRGSQVIQGPLLVIPIEESLIYIRPLYLKAETGKIPELKRVIVAYENKIAMEETLEQALAKIFGTRTEEENPVLTETPVVEEKLSESEIIKQAQILYEEAITAQREGNWARYGEAIKKLGDLLKNQ